MSGDGKPEVEETTTIVPVERREMKVTGVADLLVNADEALRMWKTFEDFKAKILVPWGQKGTDFQRIKVKEKQPNGDWKTVDKDFPKKSAARKFAKFFGISDRILDKYRVDRPDGSFIWHYTVEAWTPNGQIVTGEAACDSNEVHDKRKIEHNTKSTAHTRAKSRAIFDLVGGGEVSAEEITLGGETHEGRVMEADYKVKKQPSTNGVPSFKNGKGVVIQSITPKGIMDYLAQSVAELKREDFDIKDLGGAYEIKTKKWIDYWGPVNGCIVALGGEWISFEEENKKKDNHWWLPRKDEQEGTPSEAQPPSAPSPSPDMQVSSIEELEAMLKQRVPGMDELVDVTQDGRGFSIEPRSSLDSEIVETISYIVEGLGGRYEERQTGVGYEWLIDFVAGQQKMGDS